MDFLLGIFTGISIAILWGMYLNKQKEKKAEKDKAEHFEAIKKAWRAGMITPEDLEYLNSSHPTYPISRAHALCLSKQLQAAIENENFEEAARLRDLMNKK